jgi:alpha-beta hydrolase superfamily lysophospholipase
MQRRLARIGGIFGVAIAVLLASSAAVAAFVREQPVRLPRPSGPLSVGRATLHVEDSTRPEPGQPTLRRQIMVQAYFPTEQSPGQAAYMPDAIASARVDEHAFAGLFFANPRVIRTNSLDGAQPSSSRDSNLILFMPGAGQETAEYTSLLEDLASRGSIVLAMSPAGNAPVLDAGGRLVPAQASVYSAPEDSPEHLQAWGDAQVQAWAADADVAYVHTLAESFLSGVLAPGHPFMAIGHSLGGAAALELCANAQGCLGAVDIDGWPFGDVTTTGLGKPVLVMQSEQAECDEQCARADRELRSIVDSAGVDGTSQVYPGFGHFDFSDHAVLYDPLLHAMGLLGPVDGTIAIRDTRSALDTFIAKYASNRATPPSSG